MGGLRDLEVDSLPPLVVVPQDGELWAVLRGAWEDEVRALDILEFLEELREAGFALDFSYEDDSPASEAGGYRLVPLCGAPPSVGVCL